MLEKSREESWEGEGGQAPGGEEGGGEGEEGQAPEGGQKVAELPDSWVKSFFKGWQNNKDLKGLIWAWSDTSALWVFEVMLILSIMAYGHQVMLVMRTKLPWICTLDSELLKWCLLWTLWAWGDACYNINEEKTTLNMHFGQCAGNWRKACAIWTAQSLLYSTA